MKGCALHMLLSCVLSNRCHIVIGSFSLISLLALRKIISLQSSISDRGFSSCSKMGQLVADKHVRYILMAEKNEGILLKRYVTRNRHKVFVDKINVEKAVDYIVSCKNLDGGFGCTP